MWAVCVCTFTGLTIHSAFGMKPAQWKSDWRVMRGRRGFLTATKSKIIIVVRAMWCVQFGSSIKALATHLKLNCCI